MAQITLSPQELQSTLDRFLGNPADPVFDGPSLSSPPHTLDWSFEQIQPPPQLYLAPEDRIQYRMIHTFSSQIVKISGRILNPYGDIIPFEQNITTGTGYSPTTGSVEIGEGFLLSLSVSLVTQALPPGACYAQVGVLRNPNSIQQIDLQLIGDYLTPSYSPTWPGFVPQQTVSGAGRATLITVPQPSVGAEWIQSVQNYTEWLMGGGSAFLLTSAVAGNRVVQFFYDDGVSLFALNTANYLHPAGTLIRYVFGNFPNAGIQANASIAIIPMPALQLSASYRIGSLTAGLLAGDQWSGVKMFVREWIRGD